MPLPNLIVIGASKCGTTSLHRYLNRHPQIAMSRDKELNFFIEEQNSVPCMRPGTPASWLGRSLETLPQHWYWRLREPLYWALSRRIERPTLSATDRAALAERLRDDTNRFRQFVGREFADWSV